MAASMLALAQPSTAQTADSPAPTRSPRVLKSLTLEELLDVEVTSVSRRSERLTETASAVQVITGEEIRRSTAVRLPEALRLASNLQVARISADSWAISARGFNNALANKLLVLLDGRTLYSPLFAGTFWQTQDTLLEDVERIEVVSGPGASVWGANAVNGVINVTTRSARDTHGLLLKAGAGDELRSAAALRYGGAIGSDLHYRVYGKYTDQDGAVWRDGTDVDNDWRMGQGGARFDWARDERDTFTVQGDAYATRADQPGTPDVVARGHNVVARWSRTLSSASELGLQVYTDRAFRRNAGQYADDLRTYDIDFQHRFSPLARHDLTWGVGYRRVEDDFESMVFVMDPEQVTLERFSGFVQDTIAIVPERLHLTAGSKFEDNEYTGFEWQPSIRAAWTPVAQYTLWGAVSRALRTPSRLERDLANPASPPFFVGNESFESEELLAYELGLRLQPRSRLSLTLATYYNDYDRLRSFERRDPAQPVPFTADNSLAGRAYGVELTADYRPTDAWRVWAGYSHLDVALHVDTPGRQVAGGTSEARDPDQQLFVRSSLNLPGGWELDAAARYVDRIEDFGVPAYTELDLRIAWLSPSGIEWSLAGRNLLDEAHREFGSAGGQEFERSVHGRLVWRR